MKVLQNKPVYIVDGSRTPYLKFAVGANPFTAADLAVATAKILLLRQNFTA